MDYLSGKVQEIDHDSKRLYGLYEPVKKLTNDVKENPMPPDKTEELLAEEFVIML